MALIVLACPAWGRTPDSLMVRLAAEAFWQQHAAEGALVEATPKSLADRLHLFVPASGRGFVLLPASDAVRPVLAYSTHDAFLDGSLPPAVEALMEQYVSAVEYAQARALPPHPAWRALIEGGGHATKDGRGAGSLLTTLWGQSWPYNSLCPIDSTWDPPLQCVAGCTATAMAQIMRYWEWPETGWGRHEYEAMSPDLESWGLLSEQFDTVHYRWDAMPDSMPDTGDLRAATALGRLVYDCGVAVNMCYSGMESAGSVWSADFPLNASAVNALRTYFRYRPEIVVLARDECPGDEWAARLKAELDAGRPMLYTATSPRVGGHALVMDGYDADGLMHINLGWYGRYNGFYAVDSFLLSDNFCFNSNHIAVLGITPNREEADSVLVSIVPDSPALGTCSGSGRYAFADTLALMAQAEPGARFAGWRSGSGENPRQLLATATMADTACFLPLAGDTLGYAGMEHRDLWPWHLMGTVTRWGIRLPASVLHGNRVLCAVDYIRRTYYSDSVRVKVYAGSAPDGNALAEVQRWVPAGGSPRVRLPLDEPLHIDTTADLWIVFEADSGTNVGNHYCRAAWCGNRDGGWIYSGGDWSTLDAEGVYATWQVWAITAEVPPTEGIEEVEAREAQVDVLGRRITVSLPRKAGVLQVYDMAGRCLQTASNQQRVTFHAPCAGVYAVVCDGALVQRVVVQ